MKLLYYWNVIVRADKAMTEFLWGQPLGIAIVSSRITSVWCEFALFFSSCSPLHSHIIISTATRVALSVISCKMVGNVNLWVIKIKMISSSSAAQVSQWSKDKLKYQFLSFSILRHYLSYSLEFSTESLHSSLVSASKIIFVGKLARNISVIDYLQALWLSILFLVFLSLQMKTTLTHTMHVSNPFLHISHACSYKLHSRPCWKPHGSPSSWELCCNVCWQ